MTRASNPNKIKVCLVSISLGKGGAERSCAMLSRMLTNLGIEVHTIILNNEVHQEYSGVLFNLGIQKKGNQTILKRFLRIRKIRRYLRENRIDYVIDHRQKNQLKREKFYANYIYKGFNRIYVVHSAKDQTYLSESSAEMARIYNGNYATVAVSEHIARNLSDKYGIARTLTIPNAFDPQWKEHQGALPEILTNKKYILAYGRIEDRIKDFSFLIEAYGHSSARDLQVYLVIMGDGPDKDTLISQVQEMGLSENVLFLQHTDQPFSVIKKALFTTLTSHYEGFPMVLTESLSLGTPMICLDIPSGPAEIIRDRENGLLISKRSIPLFAEAINEMLTNEELFNRCENNARSSVANFSMEAIGTKWNQLLRDGIG